jgi:ferritin
MLSQSMQDAFNNQMIAEAYSGYLYLSMSSYFESKGLKGMAKWMAHQAREEFYHTSKFYHYILERGGRAILAPIDGPQTEWDSPLKVWENVLSHEQKVTGLINDLMNMAKKENDHASEVFLQWFVSEQVEEEAAADEILQKMKIAGETGAVMFMMDNELGQRALSPLVAAAMVGAPAAE